LSSTATQRRYNSSTSGWSEASASTRAITRRCSVMRMPVAAQRASMPVAFGAGDDFNTVMEFLPCGGRCATSAILRQVAADRKCIQVFPAGLLIIALAASDDSKAASLIKPQRRCVIFLYLQKYAPDASACKMAEMGQKQISGKAAAAFVRVNRDRQDLGLIRADA